MESMTGTGLEFKLLLGIKYITIALLVWFTEPIVGFVAIKADAIGLLTPTMRANMGDIKIILAVLVPLLLAVKYVYDILKTRKELNKK